MIRANKDYKDDVIPSEKLYSDLIYELDRNNGFTSFKFREKCVRLAFNETAHLNY